MSARHANQGPGPMGPNGRPSPHDIIGGASVPIIHISRGQRWKCPTCGDEPKNLENRPGVPEGVATQLNNDEPQYHCGVCFQKWQAEDQVRRIRAGVPAMVKIEDNASGLH